MLNPKTVLSERYEILSPLGAGGMGEVYRARDQRLGRDVAIKILPEQVAANPDALARFEREGKALAALSHPNILAIYDFGRDQGISYAVMELLKGETLRAFLKHSAIPWKGAIEIAIPIAEGLSAAHSAGIVHRDLKPENIFLTSDDRVKILDFGLARRNAAVAAEELTSAPTATRHTAPDVVMGTVPYMSPEQIRGAAVDSRTDIFSFGCMLYEMVTGKRPFQRETSPETMTAILKEDPAPLPADIPAELQRTVSHCLEKKPDDRFQSARDLAFDLKTIFSTATSTPVGATRRVALGRATGSPLQVGIVVLAILLLASAVWLLRNKFVHSAAREKSIAVLPFTNLSENKEDEYFSDGMTEDVITQLSKIGDLKVISRTSVMPYKKSSKSLREIGSELGVAVVLEGSVRRAGNRLRIVGQLIDATTDEHIWADTYDRDLKDVFEIQSDVAQQIASALKAKLSPVEKVRIEKKPTQNTAAYDDYLKGREYWHSVSKENNEKAIELFKKALELDPNFALAYAGLGDAYSLRTVFGFPETWLDSAIEVSKKAISIDPNLAEGYEALAYAYHFKGWYHKALQPLQKALELNPNYARAAGVLGKVLWLLGRLDEALPWVKKYQQLDPTSATACRYVGDVYGKLGDLPKAKQWYEKGIATDPASTECYQNLMFVYQYERNTQQIRALMQKLLSIAPDSVNVLSGIAEAEFFLGNLEKAKEYCLKLPADWQEPLLAYIMWKQGDRETARKLFDQGLKYRESQVSAGSEELSNYIDIAGIHAIQGNKPQAYQVLQKAIEAGFVEPLFLESNPVWQNLRGDAQFQQMMAALRARVAEMRKRAEQE